MTNGEKAKAASAFDWKELGYVAAFGAVGGFLWWLYSTVTAQAVEPWKPLGFLPFVVLGAGASPIGVYLLANSDTRAFGRSVGLAIACGFAWRPVYEAGQALVLQKFEEGEIEAETERTEELAAAVAGLPADQASARLPELERHAARLAIRIPTIRNSALRQKAEASAEAAIEAASKHAEKKPDEAMEVFAGVGDAAARVGAFRPAEAARRSLEKIGRDPQTTDEIRRRAGVEVRRVTERLRRN